MSLPIAETLPVTDDAKRFSIVFDKAAGEVCFPGQASLPKGELRRVQFRRVAQTSRCELSEWPYHKR